MILIQILTDFVMLPRDPIENKGKLNYRILRFSALKFQTLPHHLRNSASQSRNPLTFLFFVGIDGLFKEADQADQSAKIFEKILTYFQKFQTKC